MYTWVISTFSYCEKCCSEHECTNYLLFLITTTKYVVSQRYNIIKKNILQSHGETVSLLKLVVCLVFRDVTYPMFPANFKISRGSL